MAISFSFSGVQAAPQPVQLQMRLNQAQRTADSAESQARMLQSQLQSARSASSRASEKAHAIEGQATQADLRSERARQAVTSIHSSPQASKSSATTNQVKRAYGQTTGLFVNTTA